MWSKNMSIHYVTNVKIFKNIEYCFNVHGEREKKRKKNHSWNTLFTKRSLEGNKLRWDICGIK